MKLIAPEIAAARLRHVIARLPLWEAGECSKYADLIEWQANRIRELERIHSLFERLVVEITPSGCHIWTGTSNKNGYGILRADGRKHVKAHRLAWELANGRKIPRGMVIMHKCDVPSCVNPNHLILGTQADNMKDMGKKGRSRGGACGEKQGSAKLTEADIRAIRNLCKTRSKAEVAKLFGVHRTNVSLIADRKSWCHVCD